MRWRTVSSGLQRNIVAEVADIQIPVVRGLVIAVLPSQVGRVRVLPLRFRLRGVGENGPTPF